MGRLDSGWKQAVRGGFLLLAFLAAVFGSARAWGGGAENLNPGDAQALIRENSGNPDFVVLDVRTPGEFARGHLEGALLIDYHSPEFRDRMAGLDRTKSYLVYCRTGSRSSRTVRIMNELGFQHIYHLEGGILRWLEEGLPAVR